MFTKLLRFTGYIKQYFISIHKFSITFSISSNPTNFFASLSQFPTSHRQCLTFTLVRAYVPKTCGECKAVLSPISGDHYSTVSLTARSILAVLSPISGDHYSFGIVKGKSDSAVLSPISGDHYSPCRSGFVIWAAVLSPISGDHYSVICP